VAESKGPLLSPGFWLHHAALTWRRQLDTRLATLGLTHTQFNLLASTSWLGRDVTSQPTQQQVADMAGADRMMASKVLGGLEARGLVVRDAHPSDTRAKRLAVTPTGRALVSKAVKIVAEIDESVFGVAGPEREQLRAQLEQFACTAPSG